MTPNKDDREQQLQLGTKHANLNNLKKKHGGARPNSGVPKGYKHAKTITKEQAREALRTVVIRELEPLVQAQLDNTQAFTDLMNRALDKPTEQVQLQEEGAIEIRWMNPTDDESG